MVIRDPIGRLEKLLTPKRIRFCHEYILDWNASRAAKAAGYSEKGAPQLGSQLLKLSNVQDYIKLIQEDIAKEAGLSKIRLMQELKAIATTSLTDIYTDWISVEKFEELKKKHPEVLKAIQEINTETKEVVTGVGEPIKTVYFKIKLHDKQRAIDSIFKAMGWNAPEKTENTTTAKVDLENYSKEDKKALLTIARKGGLTG